MKKPITDDITQFSTAELVDELVGRRNSIYKIPDVTGYSRILIGESIDRDKPNYHLDDPTDITQSSIHLGPCTILVVRE